MGVRRERRRSRRARDLKQGGDVMLGLMVEEERLALVHLKTQGLDIGGGAWVG